MQRCAWKQNCVLEHELRKGYSLYSNRTLTKVHCNSINEVFETLAFDPLFFSTAPITNAEIWR